MAEINATLRKQIELLIIGGAGLEWMDRVIRKAGYTKRAEVVTRHELAEAVRAVTTTMKDVSKLCEGSCGKFFVDQVQEGVGRIERTGGIRPDPAQPGGDPEAGGGGTTTP